MSGNNMPKQTLKANLKTKSDFTKLKNIIKEYSSHDLEAFENRALFFAVMMELVELLEETIKPKK